MTESVDDNSLLGEGRKDAINTSQTDDPLQNTNLVSEIKEEVKVFSKECFCKCCCDTFSEDILYGITFLGRLIMTLYSFQALFFLYNFIINFIFLLPGMLFFTESKAFKTIIIIFYAFFASLTSNILIIPTYEFLLFPFLTSKNIMAHWESLKIAINIIHNNKCAKDEIEFKKSKFLLDILLIVIEIAYFVGFFLGFSSNTIIVKDIVREIIFIIIYLFYLIIFFGYFIVSIDLKLNLICYIRKKNNNRKFITNSLIYMDEYINDFFQERPPLPKINLLSYVINPLLQKSYSELTTNANNQNLFHTLQNYCSCSCCCKNWFHVLKNIIRLISFLLSFIIAMIISIKQDPEIYVYFLILFFFICGYFLSSMLNFPYIIRNKKVYFIFSSKYNFKKEYKMDHPVIISFIRLVSFLVVLIASLGLLYVFLTQDEKNNLETIKNLQFNPIPEEDKNKNTFLPNICFSSIYDMKINLYLPFINDAYYYEPLSQELNSSFDIPGYKELFFDNKTYDIKPIGNLIESKDKNSVKMIQYDVIKKKIEKDNEETIINEITILSIKGTTNKKDMFLDIQLYLPSVLLNLLSIFSVFSQQKDTYSFGFLEYSLSLPYRLFSQYLIIDGYLKDLNSTYFTHKSEFKDNVVIVGHSLGGGLSKILGRIVGKQAISLSGPGVNAFQSLWEFEGSSENFEISAIDLVPDMDLVPRVEVSGGTVYRIICKEGPLDCHSKELSLCEVLIMCRNPNYLQYCKDMKGLKDWQIEAIVESSKLDKT